MSGHRHSILDERGAIVPCDVLTWARWYEKADRSIARTEVADCEVSTVFLGLDHNYHEAGPPQWFETMVFGGPLDQEQARYETMEQAKAGHQEMVSRVTDALKGIER